MKLKSRLIVLSLAIFLFTVVYMLYSTVRDKKATERMESIAEDVHQPIPISNRKGISKDTTTNLSKAESMKMERDQFLQAEFNRLKLDLKSELYQFDKLPWDIPGTWVNPRQIYPDHHPKFSSILFAMTSSKIIKADVLPKGTQLKLLLVLEGNQKVVFKQKRYERDTIIEGKPYSGFDRHNGEIAAFQLDRIFNFRRSPLTVGRVLNLRKEVLPVSTDKLLKTFLEKNGNLCYYGMCYYCKESEMACADGDVMEGSVTLWLPPEYSEFVKQRHPYQRTYVEGRMAKWEQDETYCNTVVKHTEPYNKGTRLLDITDASVFDYLIGNADRHHYEVFKNKGENAMMLMLDNAKSFGNPNWHEQSILAPLRQCCILRNSTWNKLLQLQDGVLTSLLEAVLESDPIAPVLHPTHFRAMDIRLPHIMETVNKCISLHGRDKVLLNEWNGVENR